MKKEVVTFLALSVSVNVFGASQQIVWGDSKQALPLLSQESPFTRQGFVKTIDNRNTSDYKLKLIESNNDNKNHARYQITYKGILVWGHQLVFHKKKGAKKPSVTGINISGIEKDVRSTNGKLTPSKAIEPILSKFKEPIKFKKTAKVIYVDNKKKAHLAYHLFFFINDEEKPISAPNYIIDANTGKVLESWNEARTEKMGQGLGGNSFPLPYRPGMFQHGNALPNLPSLGKFDVQVGSGKCHVQNDHIMVVNLENYTLGYDAFPINVFDEAITEIEPFSYPCGPESGYINYADGHTGPVNYSFSPVNDTMYFAQKTIEMYQEVYGVDKPIGNDLPLRAFTHLGMMDNAFAIPTIEHEGVILAHQQIVIGNGSQFLTAPAQSVLAHELSHNFTQNNSGLIYKGQTGAINESFSDMAAIALQDYISKEHPWYWDGLDWTIGREAMLGGEPMRYLNDPTLDGRSIGHANDYLEGIDVHLSSGVFNGAFYLLANKPGWNVQSAFKVMIDANQNYWSPIAYFDFASCGVIQAAEDNFLPKESVIESFYEVGVQRPMYPVDDQGGDMDIDSDSDVDVDNDGDIDGDIDIIDIETDGNIDGDSNIDSDGEIDVDIDDDKIEDPDYDPDAMDIS
jgi:pseudolysin